MVSTAGRGYAGTASFNDEAVNKNTNAKQAVYSGEAPLVYFLASLGQVRRDWVSAMSDTVYQRSWHHTVRR